MRVHFSTVVGTIRQGKTEKEIWTPAQDSLHSTSVDVSTVLNRALVGLMLLAIIAGGFLSTLS